MTHQPNPKEIKFQTIGTRAVVSKKITPEQAVEIRKRPNIIPDLNQCLAAAALHYP